MERTKFYWDKPALNRCNRCGITQTERNRKPAMPTGIDHPEYCETTSFYLQYVADAHRDEHGDLVSEAVIWCPECHKEHLLEDLFATMDRLHGRPS